jgi:hypothetical protein
MLLMAHRKRLLSFSDVLVPVCVICDEIDNHNYSVNRVLRIFPFNGKTTLVCKSSYKTHSADNVAAVPASARAYQNLLTLEQRYCRLCFANLAHNLAVKPLSYLRHRTAHS